MKLSANTFRASLLLLGGFLATGAVQALDVNITEDKSTIKVLHANKIIEVRRDQDPNHLVDAMWAKTSRTCPPFCIQPSRPLEGVELLTEVDLFEFMEQEINNDTGVLIDARLPDWHLRGTIPGSVNIPFTVFQREPNDPKLVKALSLLGARPRGADGAIIKLIDDLLGSDKTEQWDFSEAKHIVLWCNGPWCGQSPHAIRALAHLGYPVEKMGYYRGGMQMWQILGLTTVVPDADEQLFADAGGSE